MAIKAERIISIISEGFACYHAFIDLREDALIQLDLLKREILQQIIPYDHPRYHEAMTYITSIEKNIAERRDPPIISLAVEDRHFRLGLRRMEKAKEIAARARARHRPEAPTHERWNPDALAPHNEIMALFARKPDLASRYKPHEITNRMLKAALEAEAGLHLGPPTREELVLLGHDPDTWTGPIAEVHTPGAHRPRQPIPLPPGTERAAFDPSAPPPRLSPGLVTGFAPKSAPSTEKEPKS